MSVLAISEFTDQSMVPVKYGELKARPQVADFGQFISTPEFRYGQRVIHQETKERGIIDSVTLYHDDTSGLPQWSYTVRYFGHGVSCDVDSFYIVAAPVEPMEGEEVHLVGTKVLSPDDPDNCGGYVQEIRFNEKYGYWKHKVLWSNGHVEWLDCELVEYESGETPDNVSFPRIGIASGKSGPVFAQK